MTRRKMLAANRCLFLLHVADVHCLCTVMPLARAQCNFLECLAWWKLRRQVPDWLPCVSSAPCLRHRAFDFYLTPCAAPRCQLPDTFSPAGAERAPDLRQGFCWGHLPAHYGRSVQLCLLVSGTDRGTQYWYNVRAKLRRRAVRGGPQPAAGQGVGAGQAAQGVSPGGGDVREGIVLELVSFAGTLCPA